jgi:hypothetical protein
MLRHVAVLRADVPKERIASSIRVTRTGELGTTLAVTSNLNTRRRNTMCKAHAWCSVPGGVRAGASVDPVGSVRIYVVRGTEGNGEWC